MASTFTPFSCPPLHFKPRRGLTIPYGKAKGAGSLEIGAQKSPLTPRFPRSPPVLVTPQPVTTRFCPGMMSAVQPPPPSPNPHLRRNRPQNSKPHRPATTFFPLLLQQKNHCKPHFMLLGPSRSGEAQAVLHQFLRWPLQHIAKT